MEPYSSYEDIGVLFFVLVFLAAVVRLGVRMHVLRSSDLVTPGLALQSFVIIFLSVSLYMTLKWRNHRPVIAPLGWVSPNALYATLASVAGIASALSIAFLAHLRHRALPTVPATDFLVPYTCARVLVPEGGPHWLALGERLCPEPADKSYRSPLTLIADKSPFLQRISTEPKSVLIPDTSLEEGWSTFKGHKQFRSWLCVPLVASGEFLGFLSAGHTDPNRYTREHLRQAELLAIPAAAAIQNARLYQTARIYGEELEKRIADLKKAETARAAAEGSRRLSEEKFQKVFRSSPIPFSITTLKGGQVCGCEWRLRAKIRLLPPRIGRSYCPRTENLGGPGGSRTLGHTTPAKRSHPKCDHTPSHQVR
jgi:hypothetical protein